MIIEGVGDWTEYRRLPGVVEVDFHYDDVRQSSLNPKIPYDERMDMIYNKTIDALQEAFNNPTTCYVLFTHGYSTSKIGKTTARSQVRNVMRSKEATPFILRKNCVRDNSVFVAAIRGRNHDALLRLLG
jgi:hypothetical protein